MAPPLAALRALIFDFDGTLATGTYDFEAMRLAVCALARERGVSAQDLDGLYSLEAIEKAIEIIGAGSDGGEAFRAEAERIVLKIELRGARSARLLPDAAQAMAALRASGCRLAVVTRNSRAVIETIPGAADLACDAFLTRESVPRVKPDPAHLDAALEALDCEASEAAMVGDHVMDIAAGKAAGVATIGVLTGAGTRETLAAAGADLVVESVVELAERLVGARRRG